MKAFFDHAQDGLVDANSLTGKPAPGPVGPSGFSRRLAVFSVVCAVAAGVAVQAAPIDFTFTGVGAGIWNGNAFASAPFRVEISADTVNLDLSTFGLTTPGYFGLSGSISITGVDSGTFSNPVYVFNNQGTKTPGFGTIANNDLIDLFNVSGFDLYDMLSSIGPVTKNSPDVFFAQFSNVATSQGPLSFTSVSEATFQAVLQVPETNSGVVAGALLGAAAVGLGWRRR